VFVIVILLEIIVLQVAVIRVWMTEFHFLHPLSIKLFIISVFTVPLPVFSAIMLYSSSIWERSPAQFVTFAEP
jgi:hypothetical protein